MIPLFRQWGDSLRDCSSTFYDNSNAIPGNLKRHVALSMYNGAQMTVRNFRHKWKEIVLVVVGLTKKAGSNSETSVNLYETTWYNIQEDCHLLLPYLLYNAKCGAPKTKCQKTTFRIYNIPNKIGIYKIINLKPTTWRCNFFRLTKHHSLASR
jgi:hypothetical protein